MALQIDLTGKKALVTGATRGIGAGVATALALAGCDVVGCATSPPASENAAHFIAGIEALGRKAAYFQANLTEPDAPANLVHQAQIAFGTIDILVSNAGRNIFKGAAACSEADWDECMNLDLASHWRLAQAAQPLLAHDATPGVIIIMGSNHGLHTIPGCFPYNVAKAGLYGLVQSLAIEWGPTIRTVGIAPGFIDTDANVAWFNTFPDPDAERLRTERSHPVGRVGTPEEIGALCAFLASPFGGFVSGITLTVDGGRSAIMQDE